MAAVSAAERLNELNYGRLIRIIAAILLYAVIDIIWNISPPVMGMYESLHAASGSPFAEIRRETFGPLLGIAVLAFFILIGFANAYLAIEPALKENSLARAMKNSVALGLAAYATYIVPVYMTIGNWPFVLVPIDIIIGGCLSLITSTVVTYVALRMRNRD